VRREVPVLCHLATPAVFVLFAVNRKSPKIALSEIAPLSAPSLLGFSVSMENDVQVLVIDDDETFCKLLVEILEDKGMTAAWTTDGLAGYEMSACHSYDVFIIDVRMPLLLGTELAEALKESDPRAKVILVSAFADDALFKVSRSIGVPLLSKPFSASGLIEMVERILGDSKKQRN
jgi:DNA-binding NtrC family response regulator